ncbi:protein kinase domain-containing protein [Streptomyces roseolilacinus]
MLIAERYRLREPIGRGAMGEVWRAYDETLARPVAIKLLLTQESDPTAVQRFRLEARTAGRLNHPHVVSVLDFGEHDGRLFLVMELVEGGSLARLLKERGPLPAEEAAGITAQAAAGLAAAHQQGVVHRDIKPANLLLDADGSLKIGDFGIARFLDDPSAALTGTGQIVGTGLYLAPERALGKPAAPASDVYALGCVLYQLLTGRPPFQADTSIAILHQHLDAAVEPPGRLGFPVPSGFEEYLLRLLAKRPEERPTAHQVAGWFASGSWRRSAAPLPSAVPLHPAQAPLPSAVPPPPARVSPATGPVPPTAGLPPVGRPPVGGPTTGLPPAGRPHARVVPSSGAGGRKRSRRGGLVVAVTGSVVFLAAMLAGLALFSPDDGLTTPTGPGSGATGPAATPLGRTAPSSPAVSPDGSRQTPPPPAASATADPQEVPREERRQEDEGGKSGKDREKHKEQDDD